MIIRRNTLLKGNLLMITTTSQLGVAITTTIVLVTPRIITLIL